MNKPYLSVVVVSRNDDHGGNLLQRMQLFVTGWLEQAERHNLSSELVIVEWNPPPDRPRLARTLKWPDNDGPCEVRIIEVPPEIHQRYKYAEQLPLFQMIGKNVGIRRAKGRFILATNIDILFSDELMEYLASGQLAPDRMYRIDRYDVPSDVPENVSIEEQLQYCRDNVIRINKSGYTQIMDDANQPRGRLSSLFRAFTERLRALRSVQDAVRLIWDIVAFPYRIFHFYVLRPFIYGGILHTNACGDFTLMASECWTALRGNAEFETFSLHLDGLMCAVAHYGGAREIILPDPMRIYHIEHAPGSGWAPGIGAKLLDERLKTAGISQLTTGEYRKHLKRIRWHRGPTIYNDENWGLGQESLEEETIIKADWETN